jgi:hypothetical protein
MITADTKVTLETHGVRYCLHNDKAVFFGWLDKIPWSHHMWDAALAGNPTPGRTPEEMGLPPLSDEELAEARKAFAEFDAYRASGAAGRAESIVRPIRCTRFRLARGRRE